jgi:N-acetylmuramoyl-L-alanine amidase-like protein
VGLRRTVPVLIALLFAVALLAQPAAAHERSDGLIGSAGITNPHPAGAVTRLVAMAVSGPDYPSALWRPASPWNYTLADRPLNPMIRRLVIHVAEGGFASTYDWFGNSAAEASANYVVSASGQVAQMVPNADIAWHAGNWSYNETSIGIEHAGYTNVGGFSDAQYRGSARLAGWLARTYAITPDRAHVIGHNEVPDPYHPGEWGGADHHTDPGRYWKWGRYMAYLRLFAATTPQRQVDDGSATRFAAGPGWNAASPRGSLGGGAHVAPVLAGAGPARYRLALPGTDAYDVFMRWPCVSGADRAARVQLSTAAGLRSVTVDQAAGCATWRHLGSWRFAAGDAWRVSISRRFGHGLVLADAVLMVKWSDIGPPSVVSELSARASTSSSIEFDWGGATDNMRVWGYQAALDGRIVSLGAGHTHIATRLPCGTAHTVTVRAVDMVGNRSPKRTLAISTEACPPAPSNLRVTGSTADSIALSWDTVSGAVRYQVSAPGLTTRRTAGTTLSFPVLTCATGYTFSVIAQDAAGSWSSVPATLSAQTAAC